MNAESEGVQPSPHIVEELDLTTRRKNFIPQDSSIAAKRQQAICVRRAHKIYGTKKNPNVVLDGLNMTVPKGCIYGLLGSSGCGKTTLLACIVGRRRLNSGEIWVLGGTPGSRGSGVPGPRIGYMPQEVALYGEFTMREILLYFGWMAGMKTKRIKERTDLIINLLNLPDNGNKLIKHLSGGQQRRTSLASALLHEPELLILDEPTVGVDPILRQSIWDHLLDITKNGNTTVIITTHYIDETKQAGTIGLLRGGKMLAEESPESLLRKHGVDSLETVFLKLAISQNQGKRRRSSIAQEVIEQIRPTAVTNPALDLTDDDGIGEISGEFGDNVSMSSARGREHIPENDHLPAPPLPPQEDIPASFWYNFKVMQSNHLYALVWKNFLWMMRNVGVMLFIIGLPVMQIILFCMTIGHDPTGLKLAISNHELDANMIKEQYCPTVPGCNQTYLSCRFLNRLVSNKSVVLKYTQDDEAAFDEVRRGKAWGAVVFTKNYSASLVERTETGRSVDDWTVESSEVTIRLDMSKTDNHDTDDENIVAPGDMEMEIPSSSKYISDQQISTLLYRDIQYTFFDFVEDMLTDCDVNPRLGRVPIEWNVPIYGDREPNFTDFAAPGVILTIIFFLSVAITSGAMLIERNDGMLERCLVAGITGPEILVSQIATQFTLVLTQIFFVLLFSFYVFDITIRGELGLVILLCILNGLCGMSFGFVIACAVDTERTATYVALGSFLPMIMLCGIIWPIEGMYPLLQIASFFLPLTKPTESLRAILQKGWGFSQPSVYNGFISISIWVLMFLVLTILLLKFKKG